MLAYLLWLCFLHVAAADDRPNILLLLTDDQDIVLGSFDHMPHVKTLLQEQGMTFDNAFVHTPICCPSRSQILTGRYTHHGVALNNSLAGNCYGTAWIENIENGFTYGMYKILSQGRLLLTYLF
jgi:N-acetylglucosamine-6-sulfatase